MSFMTNESTLSLCKRTFFLALVYRMRISTSVQVAFGIKNKAESLSSRAYKSPYSLFVYSLQSKVREPLSTCAETEMFTAYVSWCLLLEVFTLLAVKSITQT